MQQPYEGTMDEANIVELPRQFFARQDQLKGRLPAELCAAEYTAEIAGFPRMDMTAHGEFGTAFYAGFPDIFHTVDETLVDGNRVATRFTLRGTHTGSFMGIPASGKRIEVQAFVWLTTQQGKVTRLQALFDQLGLLRQIGALPE
jgi:predicted ester cyclase